MKQISLSPSKLSLFKECKRCFWLDVNEGKKRPEGPFSSLPNGMDLVLKKYFDNFRYRNCLPPEIGEIKGSLFNDMEKLKVWRNNFKGLEYFDKRTGVVLRGALDDLFVAADGSHVPIDFKTRGFPLKEDTTENYQHQMDIYCLLLEKNGIKAGDFAFLIFFYPIEAEGDGKFKFQCDVVKLKTSKQKGENLFREAIKVLKGKKPKTNPDCPWCNWNKS